MRSDTAQPCWGPSESALRRWVIFACLSVAPRPLVAPHPSLLTKGLAPHLALAAAQVAFGLIGVFGQIVFQPGGLSPLAVGAWRLTA